MDKARPSLGLALLSVDTILAADAVTDPQVLITPVSSESRLLSLLHHVQKLVPLGTVKLFSLDDPVRHTTGEFELAGLDITDADLSTLHYPVSLFMEQPADGNIQSLVHVVAQLRDPQDGCPWDLEQTPQSLTQYILEEAYEVIEAIQSQQKSAIADELGDLLLQVVLQAQIARESGDFALQDVTQGITDKLIRRHPHVFGDVDVDSVDEVRARWESIKATEQGLDPEDNHQLSRKMAKDAKTFPPIIGGLKLAKRAAQAGLEWPDLAGVWAKFYEELAEFQEALLTGQTQAQLEELGDLLFTLINVARWCKLDPSMALGLTNQKLIQRVQFIESQADKPLTEYSLEELDALWNRAKQTFKELEAKSA